MIQPAAPVGQKQATPPPFTVAAGTPLAEVEHQYIDYVLARLNGKVRLAALELDISARTLREKLRRYRNPTG